MHGQRKLQWKRTKWLYQNTVGFSFRHRAYLGLNSPQKKCIALAYLARLQNMRLISPCSFSVDLCLSMLATVLHRPDRTNRLYQIYLFFNHDSLLKLRRLLFTDFTFSLLSFSTQPTFAPFVLHYSSLPAETIVLLFCTRK